MDNIQAGVGKFILRPHNRYMQRLYRDIILITENQMKKDMENVMETP